MGIEGGSLLLGESEVALVGGVNAYNHLSKMGGDLNLKK